MRRAFGFLPVPFAPSTAGPSSPGFLPARYDEEATHILLRLVPSLKPVGTIRCVKLKDYYKLTRLAVLKDYRQYRFGRALVESLHAFVRAEARASASAATLGEPGVVKVAAHSQIPVKGFYGRWVLALWVFLRLSRSAAHAIDTRDTDRFGYVPEVRSLRRAHDPAGGYG